MSAAALGTVESVVGCTFGTLFDTTSVHHANPDDVSYDIAKTAAEEWRTFYPGIFGGLYAICMSGYKRYVVVEDVPFRDNTCV